MLAIGTHGKMSFVNAATGKERWNVQAHPANLDPVSVALSPDGTAIASCGGWDKSWKMWDAVSGVERFHVKGHSSGGGCICESERMRDRGLHPDCKEPGHFGWLFAIAFSPCGLRVLTGGDDRAAIVWDACTGKMEMRLLGHADRVSSLSFSPDGAWICVGCYDGSVRMSDATTGAVVGTWGHVPTMFGGPHVSQQPTPLSFSPDGLWIAKGAVEDSFGLEVLNAKTGERLIFSEGHTDSVWSICFSPDGRMIATASMDESVCIWDAGSGEQKFFMQGHDCKGLCSCVLDEEGEFRDYCDPFCVVDGHSSEVRSVCFSPDGRILVSGSEDDTCNFWDVVNGELLWDMDVPVWSVAFGRDWERDQRCVAFAMGHHERLGGGSRVQELDEGVVRMVLEAVDSAERDEGASARLVQLQRENEELDVLDGLQGSESSQQYFSEEENGLEDEGEDGEDE